MPNDIIWFGVDPASGPGETVEMTLPMISKSLMYTHKLKGGSYRVEEVAKGAGVMHGTEMVIYRDTVGGGLYSRLLPDFIKSMAVKEG